MTEEVFVPREMRDHLLLIDDDIELCQLLREYLEPEGFNIHVAHDGASGLNLAFSTDASLMILDVMLPELNGLDVLRSLRAKSSLPVLLLSAKGSEVDRIVGLELGADDYLPKPFNPRELVARVRAILRRSSTTQTSDPKIVVGDVELDPSRREVRRAGRPIELTAVEFNMLTVLLRSAGKIVKRDELSKLVLDRVLSPFDRSIDVHVSKIRKKLNCDPARRDRIKTIRAVGYIYALGDESRPQ